jgi:hypothetical protein
MAQTRHHGQRHGISDVGRHDARQGQQGVQQEQHGHANGTCTHRSEGDQGADQRTKQHRQAPVAGRAGAGFVLGGQVAGHLLAAHGLVEHGRRRQQQGHTQSGGHQRLHLWGGRAHPVQKAQRQQASRNAARTQQAHHTPRHDALSGKADGAAHLGEGRKQQVGAHGHVGLDAKEKDQQRRHQGAAAHPRQAHDGAHEETCKDISQINHGGDCKGALCLNKRFFSWSYILLTYKSGVGPWLSACCVGRLERG